MKAFVEKERKNLSQLCKVENFVRKWDMESEKRWDRDFEKTKRAITGIE